MKRIPKLGVKFWNCKMEIGNIRESMKVLIIKGVLHYIVFLGYF